MILAALKILENYQKRPFLEKIVFISTKTLISLNLINFASKISKQNKLINNDIKSLEKIGNFYFEKKNYPNAIKYFQLIPNKSITKFNTISNYALSCYFSNQFQKSIKLFHRSIEINPNNNNAWLILAICYEKINDYHNSIKSCKRFLNNNPDDIDCLYRLAKNQILIKDIINLNKTKLKIIKLNKNNLKVNDLLGDIEKINSNYKLAIEYYKNNKKYQDNPNIIKKIAFCYENLEKKDEAIKYYQKVLNKYDYNPEIWESLGKLNYEIGNIEKSKNYYRMANDLKKYYSDFENN